MSSKCEFDYQFPSAAGEFCPGQQAKAIMLTRVDMDFGEVNLVQVNKKGDDPVADH